MTEHKTKPVGLFIGIAIGTVFLALGIAVWFKGPQYGWSRDTRIIIELCLFSALLLSVIFVKYFEAVLLWIASLRAAQWLACYDEQKRAQTGVERGTASDVTTPDWAASLRSVLRDRHGWRWRYWGALGGRRRRRAARQAPARQASPTPATRSRARPFCFMRETPATRSIRDGSIRSAACVGGALLMRSWR